MSDELLPLLGADDDVLQEVVEHQVPVVNLTPSSTTLHENLDRQNSFKIDVYLQLLRCNKHQMIK
jgi:hypothetical protein